MYKRQVKVSPNGKPSRTLFRIVDKLQGFTVIEAQPITGRTHQIRVHTKAAGYPIAGDVKYGVDSVNQQLKRGGRKELFLHAQAVQLPIDDKDFINVEAPVPSYWSTAIDLLTTTD